MGGTLHLPQPPGMPPVRTAAHLATLARTVPKTAPKPPPKKSPPHQYGSYTNIRYVLWHLGGLATEQRGSKEINFCPWSRLDGAGRCSWRAGKHCRPTHAHPRDLSDHLLRDHGSDPAQRSQAMAMLAGIMPGGQAGLLHRPKQGPERSRCPRAPVLRGGKGHRSRQHRVGRVGVRQRLLRGARGQVRRAVEPRDRPLFVLGRDRRQPP